MHVIFLDLAADQLHLLCWSLSCHFFRSLRSSHLLLQLAGPALRKKRTSTCCLKGNSESAHHAVHTVLGKNPMLSAERASLQLAKLLYGAQSGFAQRAR